MCFSSLIFSLLSSFHLVVVFSVEVRFNALVTFQRFHNLVTFAVAKSIKT